MAERYHEQSALAHLHLAARAEGAPSDAGVRLSERPFRGQINLRGSAQDPAFMGAIEAAAGLGLPTEPNTFVESAGRRALWLGPDEWLIVWDGADESQAADDLRKALAGQHCAVTEVGHSRTVIGLSGPRARAVLQKGCGLDLHPRAFGPGRCAQTLFARADMILLQSDDAPTYDIDVRRSFAHYVWTWLEDASLEFGFEISEG